MSNQIKYCQANCEFFSCRQGALTDRENRIYCRWVDDECSGSTCNYSDCSRHRLLSNRRCGLTVKRKTDEEDRLNEENRIKLKLRGKVLQRLKDQELY